MLHIWVQRRGKISNLGHLNPLGLRPRSSKGWRCLNPTWLPAPLEVCQLKKRFEGWRWEKSCTRGPTLSCEQSCTSAVICIITGPRHPSQRPAPPSCWVNREVVVRSGHWPMQNWAA